MCFLGKWLHIFSIASTLLGVLSLENCDSYPLNPNLTKSEGQEKKSQPEILCKFAMSTLHRICCINSWNSWSCVYQNDCLSLTGGHFERCRFRSYWMDPGQTRDIRVKESLDAPLYAFSALLLLWSLANIKTEQRHSVWQCICSWHWTNHHEQLESLWRAHAGWAVTLHFVNHKPAKIHHKL